MTERVAVIGLGYVGLPLAVALAGHADLIGFDISRSRIAELRAGHDRTGEVADGELVAARLAVTDDPGDLAGATLFIATVPTPVTADRKPDLRALEAACATIGRALSPGALVVFESTVYPGVTEDICGAWLEIASGLKAGQDFFLGYSPERVNPGDRSHGLSHITKIVAAQTPAALARMEGVYGPITGGNLYRAPDIKTAEAAKAIENAQRDLNIAFINEVTMIFGRMDLSIHAVLDAARTKWNFLPFEPGMVGGHCIGVDPYYLADLAERLGHAPEIVLAGRRINDGMADWFAARIAERIPLDGPVLVLGATFKENVPDLRNSKIPDLVEGLRARGREVVIHDPLADPTEALTEHGLALAPELAGRYAALVLAVPHRAYRDLDPTALLAAGGLIADIKGIWRTRAMPEGYTRWHP